MACSDSLSLPSWVRLGSECRWWSTSQKTWHPIIVTSVDNLKKRVVVQFKANGKIWKTVPFSQMGPHSPMQPLASIFGVAENGAPVASNESGTATPPWYDRLAAAELRERELAMESRGPLQPHSAPQDDGSDDDTTTWYDRLRDQERSRREEQQNAVQRPIERDEEHETNKRVVIEFKKPGDKPEAKSSTSTVAQWQAVEAAHEEVASDLSPEVLLEPAGSAPPEEDGPIGNPTEATTCEVSGDPDNEAWVQLETKAGRTYFWNRVHKTTGWVLPPGACAKWTGTKGPNGSTYYWNDEGETVWTLPPLPMTKAPTLAVAALATDSVLPEMDLVQEHQISAAIDKPSEAAWEIAKQVAAVTSERAAAPFSEASPTPQVSQEASQVELAAAADLADLLVAPAAVHIPVQEAQVELAAAADLADLLVAPAAVHGSVGEAQVELAAAADLADLLVAPAAVHVPVEEAEVELAAAADLADLLVAPAEVHLAVEEAEVVPAAPKPVAPTVETCQTSESVPESSPPMVASTMATTPDTQAPSAAPVEVVVAPEIVRAQMLWHRRLKEKGAAAFLWKQAVQKAIDSGEAGNNEVAPEFPMLCDKEHTLGPSGRSAASVYINLVSALWSHIGKAAQQPWTDTATEELAQEKLVGSQPSDIQLVDESAASVSPSMNIDSITNQVTNVDSQSASADACTSHVPSESASQNVHPPALESPQAKVLRLKDEEAALQTELQQLQTFQKDACEGKVSDAQDSHEVVCDSDQAESHENTVATPTVSSVAVAQNESKVTTLTVCSAEAPQEPETPVVPVKKVLPAPVKRLACVTPVPSAPVEKVLPAPVKKLDCVTPVPSAPVEKVLPAPVAPQKPHWKAWLDTKKTQERQETLAPVEKNLQSAHVPQAAQVAQHTTPSHCEPETPSIEAQLQLQVAMLRGELEAQVRFNAARTKKEAVSIAVDKLSEAFAVAEDDSAQQNCEVPQPRQKRLKRSRTENQENDQPHHLAASKTDAPKHSSKRSALSARQELPAAAPRQNHVVEDGPSKDKQESLEKKDKKEKKEKKARKEKENATERTEKKENKKEKAIAAADADTAKPKRKASDAEMTPLKRRRVDESEASQDAEDTERRHAKESKDVLETSRDTAPKDTAPKDIERRHAKCSKDAEALKRKPVALRPKDILNRHLTAARDELSVPQKASDTQKDEVLAPLNRPGAECAKRRKEMKADPLAQKTEELLGKFMTAVRYGVPPGQLNRWKATPETPAASWLDRILPEKPAAAWKSMQDRPPAAWLGA